ncbi:TetR/AcrR family transcriptional regulator [Pectobacterium carotovorum]|uniref:TetR/AcrR family transcriptional regulator n=1 Tax=Pectobacterium carotovorum TaxID=554 RepID=UPI00027E0C69|nr:TetR/AcrR family transcriptional regulator [Pectobacterium carotovorum]AFR02214.1 TetR family transcriptional regulator [Pectobacterium carotovorum subsp. carotovorum PCC21]
MTTTIITEIAIKHFARKGYEGASLAEISSEVGIKKQSIYSHFSGKDELFITALSTVVERDITFVEHYFVKNNTVPFETRLKGLLDSFRTQFLKDDDIRLLLRMSFFPPEHLEEKVFSLCSHYSEKMYELFMPIFMRAHDEGEISKATETEVAVEGYIALMDCIFL